MTLPGFDDPVNIWLVFGILVAILVLYRVIDRIVPSTVRAAPGGEAVAVLKQIAHTSSTTAQHIEELAHSHRGTNKDGVPLSESEKLKIPWYCKAHDVFFVCSRCGTKEAEGKR